MKSSRRKRLSIIAFTVLLLIVPSSLYYLFFVQSQNGYYTKRNLRVLANIGSQVTTKIDNLATSLINVVKNAEQEKKEMVSPTENPEAKIERKGEKKVENKPQAAARTPKKPMDDKIKRSVELIDQAGISLKYEPNFSVQQWQASERTKGAPIQSRPQATNSNTNTGNSNSRPPAPTANSNSTITPQAPAARPPQAARNNSRSQSTGASPASLGTARDDPEPTVALTVKGEEGSFLLNLLYRSAATGAKGDRLFKSDLAKLVDPLVAHHVVDEMNDTKNRLFDQVLVAEQENGRVIFERGQSGLTVVSLDSLQNEKGGKLELNLANPASSLIDVQLAGEDYKLFLQPIRLTLSSSGDANSEGVRWVVCGLTRLSHFTEQTFAVSYTLLIVFVFMALLAVLSWPLLKLKLMGPKDRLRRSDFALTAFSALMGTALLTFLVADLYTYISLGNTFDDQLKKLSVEIRSNFQQELGSVLAQLWRSEKRMNKLASKESSGALADLYASKHEPKLNPKEWPTKKAQEYSSTANLLAGTLDWETAQYPYFNSVTWVDEDGQQRIKWTTRDETTAFVKVKDRSYFFNARDKNLWKLRHAGRDFEYTFELVNSKNTSQNVAIVAMRVPNSRWVSSIDTTLSSLMGTVLPTGHGYAVINDAGEVLFHSDEVNNLEEQFFEECDNDRTLRAAVLARANKFINAQYLGKGHRLFVSPVAGTPWMLVVFRDKQIARTINLELLTLSLVLYLIFAVFALLLISVVYLPRRGERIRRLWPHKRNAKQYELLITVNTVLLVVFLLVARLVTNETVLVICCFLVP
ncbi:MAG: cache domain-containing protein, partial [Blastocatellia bacterium]